MTALVEGKIRFLDYQVFKLQFEVSDEFKPDGDREVELNIELDVREKTDSDLNYLSLLGIKLNAGDKAFARAGFRVSMEIGGFFELAPAMNEQEKANYILLNGSSMLFSTARGIIAQLTAQTPVGKQVLPSVNMAEYVKTYVKKRAAEEAKAGKKGQKAKKSS